MDSNRWIKSEIDNEFSSGRERSNERGTRKIDGTSYTAPMKMFENLPVEMKASIKNNSYVGIYYRIEENIFARALEISLEENKKSKILVGYSKIEVPGNGSNVYIAHMLNENKDSIEVCYISVMKVPEPKDCAVIVTSSNDMKWTSFIAMIREYTRQMAR